jgi:heptosyltransferase-2
VTSGGRPHRILVRCPNWVGDLVMATPSLRALRERFADSEITLLLKPALAGILAGAPWYDRLLPLRIYGEDRRWGRLGRAAAALRGEAYDLGILLPNSFGSAWMLRRARVRRRLGYARNGRGWLLTDRVPPPRERGFVVPVPMARYYLELVGRLGCDTDREDLELHVTAEEEAAADGEQEKLGLTGTKPLIAIAPGASFGASKMWPPANFAEVADAILARRGGAAWVLPGPGEEGPARTIAERMRGRVAVTWPPLETGPLKAQIRRCALLLTNDAGGRHIASALGVPHVVVMGPTDLRYTGLGGRRGAVVRREVPCGPCHLKVCPLDHRCMTLIRPREVAEAAERVLDAGA